MKVRINEHHNMVYSEVYDPICFEKFEEDVEDQAVGVCERDTGFEIVYVFGEKKILVECKEGSVAVTRIKTDA